MKMSEISVSRLRELQSGLAPTRNLTEWLAIDQKKLLRAVAEGLGLKSLEKIADDLPKEKTPKQILLIGESLASSADWTKLQDHISDTVRCWSCYAAGFSSDNLKQSLQRMKSFADDQHFGVREIAWMAVRNRICDEPKAAIELLVPWTKSKSAFIRRFASEATRPRGVWAKHITALRNDPLPGLEILTPLHADAEKYVQDSVANWLNDAAKEHSKWVKSVTTAWLKESDSAATKYIAKRALRSLK
jgi:3-methyladenine DNA glycosylase AlkC